MSETLPRPIEPQDIRVGDRVRMTQVCEGDTLTGEFTVTHNAGRFLSTSGAGAWDADYEYRTWTLLDRPEPEPEPARPVGSRWRDPEAGAEYVKTDGPKPASYTRYAGGVGILAGRLIEGIDDAAIARLEPIPAFDPAVLWPKYAEGDECTAQDMNGLRLLCCRTRGHSGLHAAYAGGTQPVAVWGDPR